MLLFVNILVFINSVPLWANIFYLTVEIVELFVKAVLNNWCNSLLMQLQSLDRRQK
jgi:hypothetical protein